MQADPSGFNPTIKVPQDILLQKFYTRHTELRYRRDVTGWVYLLFDMSKVRVAARVIHGGLYQRPHVPASLSHSLLRSQAVTTGAKHFWIPY